MFVFFFVKVIIAKRKREANRHTQPWRTKNPQKIEKAKFHFF